VYPGYFRTDFLTSDSVARPSRPIDAYSAARASEAKHVDEINGSQPGDPVKAARATIDVFERPTAPLHLLLGSDAVNMAEAKLGQVHGDLDQPRSVQRFNGLLSGIDRSYTARGVRLGQACLALRWSHRLDESSPAARSPKGEHGLWGRPQARSRRRASASWGTPGLPRGVGARTDRSYEVFLAFSNHHPLRPASSCDGQTPRFKVGVADMKWWLGPRLFGLGLCLLALGGCSGDDHPPMVDESRQRGEGGEDTGPPPIANTPTASSGGGCTPSKSNANADVVTVRGTYGALGSVDYTILGFSTQYAESNSGVRRQTGDGTSELDLAMFADEEMARTGRAYVGNNDSPRNGPFIGLVFRLLGSAKQAQHCAAGKGRGSFNFTRFLDDDVVASGTYDFSCPASEIDVHGCFRYVR
jgi:hypothetical protein